MSADEAVELAPDAGEQAQEDGDNARSARDYARDLLGRIPKPSRPAPQDAAYGLTASLLFVAPAVAVVGIVWVVLDLTSLPVAVAVGGLAGTGYALFLLALLVRYERAITPSGE